MIGSKSCVLVVPFGSFISYKFDDNANPKASAAVVSKGVSPCLNQHSPQVMSNCVNVEFANPKSAVNATVMSLILNVIVLSFYWVLRIQQLFQSYRLFDSSGVNLSLLSVNVVGDIASSKKGITITVKSPTDIVVDLTTFVKFKVFS